MEKNLFTNFDSIFFEKTRLSILTILYTDEKASFNRLKSVLKIADGTLYSHLKKLIDAGYISFKKTIKNNNINTIYKLTEKGEKEFSQYLMFLESFVKDNKK